MIRANLAWWTRLLRDWRRTMVAFPGAEEQWAPHAVANGPYTCVQGGTIHVTRAGTYAQHAWECWWRSGVTGDPDRGPFTTVATQDIDIPYAGTGLYTGLLIVRDLVNGLTSTAPFSVTVTAQEPQTVDHIAVSPPSLSGTAGNSVPVDASPQTSGNVQVPGRTLDWESDSPAIALPSTPGYRSIVLLRAAGSTKIRVRDVAAGKVSPDVGVAVSNPLPPSSDYPHQHSQFVRFFESAFNVAPADPGQMPTTDIAGGYTSQPWTKPVTDNVGPKSPGKAIPFVYTAGPTGTHAGGSPGSFRYWNDGRPGYNRQYSEIYWRAWVRVVEPTFECGVLGLKLGGYLGYGNPSQGGTELIVGCGYWDYAALGGNDPSRFYTPSEQALALLQQNNVNRNLLVGGSSHRFRFGVPQGIELYLKLNSMQHLRRGSGWGGTGRNDVRDDGIAQLWLDNGDGRGMVQLLNVSDVAFRTPAAWSDTGRGDFLQGFNGAIWDPVFNPCRCTYVNAYCSQEQVDATTWPGNAAHRTIVNNLRVDHLYMSGVPL